MPKMKTSRGAAKRFKVKKNSIKRGTAFRSHILTKKDAKRQRSLRSPKHVNSSDIGRVKKLLALS